MHTTRLGHLRELSGTVSSWGKRQRLVGYWVQSSIKCRSINTCIRHALALCYLGGSATQRLSLTLDGQVTGFS